VQSIAGGQPLLILGVTEPLVILYGFMYAYASETLGADLFLPWAAWVCIWTSLLCFLLAVLDASKGIKYFTPFSGEVHCVLIAIVYLQVGIKVCRAALAAALYHSLAVFCSMRCQQLLGARHDFAADHLLAISRSSACNQQPV
jgi:hypothetical protein